MKDLEIKEYEGHSLALFTIKTAKKKGEQRYVALPIEEQYEPWTRNLLTFFESRKKMENKVFNLSVRNLQLHAKKIFEKHERQGLTHFLRHVRATNLVMDYGFDSTDIGIYCGWEIGLPAMAKRYITMEWRRYFSKLLKPQTTQIYA
jgi:hypothetical protein